MSAAKMVADSTQGDPPEMSSTKKRKKLVQKKKVKKKDSSKKKRRGSSDYDDSDLDLDNVVYPLGHYVKDREALLSQLFHCVQGHSLQRNIPTVLKDLPLEDLRRRCLEQLEVMSKKRIRRIIAGDDPTTISSSGTEDETTDEEPVPEVEEGEYEETGVVEEYGGAQDYGEEEGHGGVEYFEESEAQMADSTSLYTHETGDSDRDIDQEETSMGYTEQSPYQSEEGYMFEEGERGFVEGESEQETVMEEDSMDAIDSQTDTAPPRDTQDNKVKEVTVAIRKPVVREEPEEGEVIDDDMDDSGEVIKENSGDVETTIEVKGEKIEQKNSGDVKVSENVEASTANERTEYNCKIDSNISDQNQDNGSMEKADIKSDSYTIETEDTNTDIKVSEEHTNQGIEETVTVSEEPVIKDEVKRIVIVSSDSTVVHSNIEEKNKNTNEGKPSPDVANPGSDNIECSDQIKVKDNRDDSRENVDDVEGSVDDENNSENKEAGSDAASDANSDAGDEAGETEGEVVVSEVVTEAPQASQRVVRPPSVAPALTRNQMELLELEMRARAIKAMLKTAK